MVLGNRIPGPTLVGKGFVAGGQLYEILLYDVIPT